MNSTHLRYFQVLAELQHYGKASEILHTPQSNLSYAISALEEELDAKFFQKQGRNVILTPQGELFVKYADIILSTLSDAKRAIHLSMELSEHSVNVATYRIHLIDDALVQFEHMYAAKNYHFSLSHCKTKEIVQGLKRNRFDVGFCSYPIDDDWLESIPVLEQSIVALIPQHHNLAGKDTISIKDLRSENIIIPHGSDGMHQRISSLFEQAGICPHYACEADSSNAAAHLVKTNAAIALVVDNPTLHGRGFHIARVVSPPHHFYLYMTMRKNTTLPVVLSLKEYILSQYHHE